MPEQKPSAQTTQATQRLQQAIDAVIDNQLRDNNPPATGEALTRLLAAGYSRDAARQQIGQVVAAEVIAVLQQGKPYDEARYVAALKALPNR